MKSRCVLQCWNPQYSFEYRLFVSSESMRNRLPTSVYSRINCLLRHSLALFWTLLRCIMSFIRAEAFSSKAWFKAQMIRFVIPSMLRGLPTWCMHTHLKVDWVSGISISIAWAIRITLLHAAVEDSNGKSCANQSFKWSSNLSCSHTEFTPPSFNPLHLPRWELHQTLLPFGLICSLAFPFKNIGFTVGLGRWPLFHSPLLCSHK